jgi:argininosuccinate lyase
VQLLAGTVAGLSVNQAIMAQRAGQSYSGATDLAELILQEAGVDANTAHRIVGQAVRLALPTGRALDSELLDQAARNVIDRPLNISQERVAAATDPQAIIQTRTGPGGAAPQAVQAMLATFRAGLTEAISWRSETEARLAAAETCLLNRAREIAGLK